MSWNGSTLTIQYPTVSMAHQIVLVNIAVPVSCVYTFFFGATFCISGLFFLFCSLFVPTWPLFFPFTRTPTWPLFFPFARTPQLSVSYPQDETKIITSVMGEYIYLFLILLLEDSVSGSYSRVVHFTFLPCSVMVSLHHIFSIDVSDISCFDCNDRFHDALDDMKRTVSLVKNNLKLL
jgi:hypothetical protein